MSSSRSQRRAWAYPAVIRTCVMSPWLRRTHDYTSVQKCKNAIVVYVEVHYCPGKTFGTVVRNPHKIVGWLLGRHKLFVYLKFAKRLSLFRSSGSQSANPPLTDSAEYSCCHVIRENVYNFVQYSLESQCCACAS